MLNNQLNMSSKINSQSKETELISLENIYKQIKQRVDLDLNFTNKHIGKPISAITKLYYYLTDNEIESIKNKILSQLHKKNNSNDLNNITTLLINTSTGREMSQNPLNINIDLSESQKELGFDISKIIFNIKLHCNNMKIKEVSLIKYKNNNTKEGKESSTNLSFNYISPEKELEYLKNLYEPTKGETSYKNISRVRKLNNINILN